MESRENTFPFSSPSAATPHNLFSLCQNNVLSKSQVSVERNCYQTIANTCFDYTYISAVFSCLRHAVPVAFNNYTRLTNFPSPCQFGFSDSFFVCAVSQRFHFIQSALHSVPRCVIPVSGLPAAEDFQFLSPKVTAVGKFNVPEFDVAQT